MCLPTFITDVAIRLLFFGGKGGVGKSTCASAAALSLATLRPQESILLLSTDPAHSLLDALDDLVLPANLAVWELDAAASLESFKARHADVLREIAERGTFLDQEDIQGFLNLSLPGMDELMAWLEMAQWLREGRYDRLVVDTAPTGHTLRLLEMSDLLRRWLAALDCLLAKHRYLRRRFAGDCAPPDHLDHFLLDLTHAREAMETLLHDREHCRFVPVLLAEAMSVEEGADLIAALAARGLPMADPVINGLRPDDDCPVCQSIRHRQRTALMAAGLRLPAGRFLALPLFAREPRGHALLDFWNHARPLDGVGPATHAVPVLPVRVAFPARPPANGLSLLLFAGKGGVGKTTLACATALHLCAEHPPRRLLLLSTDPAHSLSDRLGIPVGPLPTMVMPGLDAQEIAPDALFAEIRDAYAEELAAALDAALPQLDLPFDRPVLERLLDLAPSGLDEIMALTHVHAHLEGGHYDLLILDTAPSGHFIRLLEMPRLIDAWLKHFFTLLLKYRRVLRLPGMAERLVEFSKGLKKLLALLQDSGRSAIHGVTLPSALALEETRDLIQTMKNLGIAMPCLFINQITPPSRRCPTCAALNQRESRVLQHARTAFGEQRQIRVYCQSEPASLAELTALGKALYRAGGT